MILAYPQVALPVPGSVGGRRSVRRLSFWMYLSMIFLFRLETAAFC